MTTEKAAERGRRRRTAKAVAGAVALLLVLGASCAPTDRPAGSLAVAGGLIGFVLLGLVLGLRLGADGRLPRRSRVAWRWIALAFVAHMLVGAFYGTAAATGRNPGSWFLAAYAVRLLLVVSLLAAAFTFPRSRSGPHAVGLLIDSLMLAGSTLLTCWYFVVGPAIQRGFDGAADVLALIIPLADVSFLAATSYVLVRGVLDHAARTLTFLIVSVSFLTVPDLYIARSTVAERLAPAHGPTLGLAAAGISVMVLACLDQFGTRPDPALDAAAGSGHTLRSMSSLPYIAVLLGYVLLLVAAAHSPFYPWGGLAVGTIIMTGGVVVRQVLQLRATERLATVDQLTGLLNRDGLRQGLDRVQDRARRSGRPAAVLLFDLDGFKVLNDTLGHAAGDDALAQFGQVLRRNVLGTDLVARLGGDEFAVTLNNVRGPQDAVVVAERILADLAEPITVAETSQLLRASVGIAMTSGDDSPRDALHRADLAMYEAKRGSGSSWRVYVPHEADDAEATASIPRA